MAKITNVGELKAFIADLPDDMIVADYDRDWGRYFAGKNVFVGEVYSDTHSPNPSLEVYSITDWSENEDGISVNILGL